MHTVSDGICTRHCLSDRVERVRQETPPGGPHYETLVRAERLRVALVTLDAGQTLQEHAAPGPMTLHVLSGKVCLSVAGDEHELEAGELIAVEERVRHAVKADAPSTFLLTVSWPAHLKGDPMF